VLSYVVNSLYLMFAGEWIEGNIVNMEEYILKLNSTIVVNCTDLIELTIPDTDAISPLFSPMQSITNIFLRQNGKYE
jgi:hypothetical protein